jgi:hypothetical protein
MPVIVSWIADRLWKNNISRILDRLNNRIIFIIYRQLKNVTAGLMLETQDVIKTINIEVCKPGF